MRKFKSNYGPDVFFRRIRMGIRYLGICLISGFFFGAAACVLYVTKVLPAGSWGLVPDYMKHLVKWKFKNSGESADYVLRIRDFFIGHYGHLIDGLYFGVICAVVSFVVVAFLFRRIGKKNEEDNYIRGAKLINPKALQRELKKHARFGYQNGYSLGRRAFDLWEEYVWRGIAIVGRPGTGKSNLIRTMLTQDLDRNAKCFIVDINGDYWRKFGRPGKDKILSLRHKESEYWDFKCEDVVPSLIASYLVEKSNSGPSFFWKAGRGVLASLLEHSKDLDDFKEKIAQSDGNILKVLKDNNELVSKVLGKAGSSQAAGVLGNSVLDFGFLRDLGYWAKAAGKEKPFSITDWATDKNDTSWVYVVVRDDELEQIKPLIACWFNLAINGCFRRDEEACYAGEYPSIRIFLDELKSLGKLEELEKAGERLRKYRASLVVGYQNNAQLDANYGVQGAENLKDVLQNKVIYSVGDPKAQEELSKLLGEQEVEETSSNVSYGRNNSDSHTESSRITRRRIVLPSEIGKLTDGDCYIKVGPFDPVKAHIEFKSFTNINDPLTWQMPPKTSNTRSGASSVGTCENAAAVSPRQEIQRENEGISADLDMELTQDPRAKARKLSDSIDVETEF